MVTWGVQWKDVALRGAQWGSAVEGKVQGIILNRLRVHCSARVRILIHERRQVGAVSYERLL